ncbi:MAG: ribonuclease III [Patescibacteria group bacterium]|nr:ribonuclease III [Patescibacteria group bacterium]MDE2116446.1 ribonuclease III [Patescibacteria group bacterium]
MDTQSFSRFEDKAKVVFKDKALLRQAFTHRSYINENKNVKLEHNERLEFLGDAVLELVVTDFLYREYPKRPEGELTTFRSALVNAITLSEVASNLNMNDFLLLSRGEAKDNGRARQYILANTFEAVVGAMYIDQGYETAKKFIERNILVFAEQMIARGNLVDAKSLFQEKAQEKAGLTPSYKLVRESGPDHDKSFTVGVLIGRDQVATGEGKSKQEAEQNAALRALEAKGWNS